MLSLCSDSSIMLSILQSRTALLFARSRFTINDLRLMQCSGEGSALAPAVIGLTPPGTCSQQRIIWPQYRCTLFTTKNKYAFCTLLLKGPVVFEFWKITLFCDPVNWWSLKTSMTLWWSTKAPLWRSWELVIIFQNWVKVKRSSWPVATKTLVQAKFSTTSSQMRISYYSHSCFHPCYCKRISNCH